MNCYYHPDTAAAAFCRSCGRPLCAVCERPAEGTVFCQDHVPAAPQADAVDPSNPYVQPGPSPVLTPVRTSPGLAFLLGWIPGVGAIYNGQYLKGLVHAVIFGLLISLINTADNTAGEPLLGMMLAGFMFYMPFEAYHTARRRRAGLDHHEPGDDDRGHYIRDAGHQRDGNCGGGPVEHIEWRCGNGERDRGVVGGGAPAGWRHRGHRAGVRRGGQLGVAGAHGRTALNFRKFRLSTVDFKSFCRYFH